MDLETITLSKASQTEKDKYHDITYMWNLKHDTNEPIYETETDPQTRIIDPLLPREMGVGEGRIGSLGLADANHYIQSGQKTGSHCTAQGTVLNILRQTIMEKNMKKNTYIYMYIYLNHFPVQQKPTQQCKSTTLQ